MGSAFVRLGRWRFVAAESAGGPLSLCVRHRPEMGMLKTRGYGQKYKLILNRQEGVSINLRAIRDFVWRVKVALRLGSRDFNICLVDDRQIRKLNAAYRGVSRSTDVLSFPWTEAAGAPGSSPGNHRPASDLRTSNSQLTSHEFAGFLGDVVISAPNARRNARAAGHATAKEIRWLILHGVLHLLGYDHEKDGGEMTALELALRERLGIEGRLGRIKSKLGPTRALLDL